MKALHPWMHTIPMAIHPFSHPCINATDPSIILAYHLSVHPPVSSVYLLIHSCSQSCIHPLTCSFNSHQHLLSSGHHVTRCKCTCDTEQLHGGGHILSAQTGLCWSLSFCWCPISGQNLGIISGPAPTVLLCSGENVAFLPNPGSLASLLFIR